MALEKSIDQLAMTDLLALIDGEVREGRKLDYKQSVPGSGSEDRKEFLYDVSSFANDAGGYLLYGISERRDQEGRQTGIPEAITGLPDGNLDQLAQRLENLLRSGIKPRVPGYKFSLIEDPGYRPVLALWIPTSWIKPHMVIYDGLQRFYSRNSSGKYPMDVQEIHAAVLASATRRERIEGFRRDRLAVIQSDETPIPVEVGPKVILHIVPIRAFDPGFQVDVKAVYRMRRGLQPLSGASVGSRYNFDGFLTFDKNDDKPSANSYLQLFRSGCLEAVDTGLHYMTDGRMYVADIALGSRLFDALRRYLDMCLELAVEPPLVIMLSLIGVRGFEIKPLGYPNLHPTPIDRDVLAPAEVLIEELGQSPEVILRPALDAIWNAAGFPACVRFDETGRWIDR